MLTLSMSSSPFDSFLVLFKFQMINILGLFTEVNCNELVDVNLRMLFNNLTKNNSRIFKNMRNNFTSE